MTIYGLVLKEFAFLTNEYNFKFKWKIKSNIHPSILFTSEDYEIQIGYNYEENSPYVLFWGVAINPLSLNDVFENTNSMIDCHKKSASDSIKVISNFIKNNMTFINCKILRKQDLKEDG